MLLYITHKYGNSKLTMVVFIASCSIIEFHRHLRLNIYIHVRS